MAKSNIIHHSGSKANGEITAAEMHASDGLLTVLALWKQKPLWQVRLFLAKIPMVK